MYIPRPSKRVKFQPLDLFLVVKEHKFHKFGGFRYLPHPYINLVPLWIDATSMDFTRSLPRCQFHRTCHSQASQIVLLHLEHQFPKSWSMQPEVGNMPNMREKISEKKAVGCYLPSIQLIPLDFLCIIITTVVWHKSTCWLWGCAGRSSGKFTILRLKPGFCLVILLLTGCNCLMLESVL